MSTEFAAAAGEMPRARAPEVAQPPGRTLLMLVRRELWEHRYLWIVPLALGALIAVLALVANIQLDIGDEAKIRYLEQRIAIMTVITWALAVPFYLATGVTVGYYLHDCLYAERKDRSILFWKSLPVSDGLTVTSKLVTGLVAVPLGTLLLALLTGLVVLAVLGVRIGVGHLPALIAWSTSEWLRAAFLMLVVHVLAVLWYAPLAAYVLLVSAWARRSPFLWAALPWLLAPLLERLAFGTHTVQHFIGARFSGIWWTLVHDRNVAVVSGETLRPLGALLHELDFAGVLADPALWLGLIATALLLLAATRIRRYRDDT